MGMQDKKNICELAITVDSLARLMQTVQSLSTFLLRSPALLSWAYSQTSVHRTTAKGCKKTRKVQFASVSRMELEDY